MNYTLQMHINERLLNTFYIKELKYIVKLMDRIYRMKKDRIFDYYLNIFWTIDKKETEIKITFNDFSNSLFKQSINMMYEYNLIICKAKEDKRKIETKKKIEEMNTAKQDFMKSLNVCEDVKRHIYSFL